MEDQWFLYHICRLNPVVGANARTLSKDLEILGYHVPKQVLYACTFIVQECNKYYWEYRGVSMDALFVF